MANNNARRLPTNNKNACDWVKANPMRLAILVLIALLAWRYFVQAPRVPGGRFVEAYHASSAEKDEGGGTLVMYFADWCPHCTKAKPAMESLQQKYGPERVRMEDCSDADKAKRFGVSSFPSYRYFPSRGRPDEHVVYNGARDLASLETYLKTH